MSASGPNDLLIIGAGTLGRLIAVDWRKAFPEANVVGETRSTTSHPLLIEAGITPALAGSSDQTFPHVVFCAPPSQSKDYPGAAEAATQRVTSGGRLAFTSSGSVHGREPTLITEQTPVVTEGRALALVEAEKRILAVPEGNIVRLAGLYTIDRGAHSFWLKRGSMTGSPEGMVNLIHYQDAARVVVSVLTLPSRASSAEEPDMRVFLGAAQKSISRRGICEAALKHPTYSHLAPLAYGNEPPGPTRIYDNSRTRQVTGWRPEFECFAEFMEADAKRYAQNTADLSSR